jgi:hypothetical protein
MTDDETVEALSWDLMTERAKALGEAEGWWLSERSDGFYEIQRFDEDPTERFSCDAEAAAHVRRCASAGSVLHIEALLRNGNRWQTASQRYVIADQANNAGWTHLFERWSADSDETEPAVVELECRFVYDRHAGRLRHLDLFEAGTVRPGSDAEILDLEDSLENANPDALESPREAGLDESDRLPGWSRTR